MHRTPLIVYFNCLNCSYRVDDYFISDDSIIPVGLCFDNMNFQTMLADVRVYNFIQRSIELLQGSADGWLWFDPGFRSLCSLRPGLLLLNPSGIIYRDNGQMLSQFTSLPKRFFS